MSTGKHIGNAVVRAVGQAIAKLRNEAGLTQEQAAEISGLDRAYWGRVEAGRQNVTIITLTLIAGALGVSAAQIVSAARQPVQAGTELTGPERFRAGVAKLAAGALQARAVLLRLNPHRVLEIEEKQRIHVEGGSIYFRGKPASPSRIYAYVDTVYPSARKAVRGVSRELRAKLAPADSPIWCGLNPA